MTGSWFGRDVQIDAIVPALRGGVLVADRAFDSVYAPELRKLSGMHWTPVAAAVRAARFLAPAPSARVLDIGAGVGKFCIVAAAVTGALVRGIERRAPLVDAAHRAAARLRVDVDIVHGTFEREELSAYDGIYLFNPFAEHLYGRSFAIDDSIALDRRRFEQDVGRCERAFRGARKGTRVVTLCGFGGEMPRGWRCTSDGLLALWEKR